MVIAITAVTCITRGISQMSAASTGALRNTHCHGTGDPRDMVQ